LLFNPLQALHGAAANTAQGPRRGQPTTSQELDMSVFDIGGANLLSTALNLASLAFPQAQLASALVNTLGQSFSSGIQSGIEQAMKQSGFPAFLADAVKSALTQSFGNQQPSADMAQTVADLLGPGAAQAFAQQAANGFMQGMAAQAEQTSESGGSGKKGWLRALAEVLGNIANKSAAELEKMGQGIAASDPKALTDYQAATQEFSLMMNTFTNAIKTIGEGNANAVRKG